MKSFRLQLMGNFLQWGCWCTKISSDCHEKSQAIYYHVNTHFIRVLRSICLLHVPSPPSHMDLSQWCFQYVISCRFNPVFFILAGNYMVPKPLCQKKNGQVHPGIAFERTTKSADSRKRPVIRPNKVKVADFCCPSFVYLVVQNQAAENHLRQFSLFPVRSVIANIISRYICHVVILRSASELKTLCV